MLPKKNRLNKETLSKVFREGKFIGTPNLNFKYLTNNSIKKSQISFVVPKKVSKSAVERNRLRRAGYNILKKHLNLIPSPLLGVFLFNKKNIDNLEKDVEKILNKIN